MIILNVPFLRFGGTLSSKNPARQLHQIFNANFDELDPEFLRQLSDELVAWLQKLQASGAPSKDVLHLRFRVREVPWLAQELRRLRLEKKLRQREVAAAMGISLSAYVRRENGTNKFTFTNVLFLRDSFYKVTDPVLRAKLEEAAKR